MLLKLKYEYPVQFIGKSVRIVRDPNAGTLQVSIFLTAAVGKNDGGVLPGICKNADRLLMCRVEQFEAPTKVLRKAVSFFVCYPPWKR